MARLTKRVGGSLLSILIFLPLSMINVSRQLPVWTQSIWGDSSPAKENELYRSGWEYTSSLPLDRHGPMHQDILGIYHHPESAAISVALQSGHDDSREACLRPYLVARLSGPAVGVVYQWTYRQSTIPPANATRRKGDNNASTAIPATAVVMEGFYDVPVTGVYFLEIIVVLCNTYDDDMLRKTEIYTYRDNIDEAIAGPAFLEQQQHVIDRCVMKPQNNKLTAFGTSIVVVKAAKSSNQWSDRATAENITVGKDEKQQLRGYWVRDMNNAREGNEAFAPLYTRYQPLDCIAVPPQNCTHPAASEARFDPYHFGWTLSNGDDGFANGQGEALIGSEASPQSSFHFVDEQIVIDKVRRKSQERANETLCMFGDSHGWQLRNQLPTFVSNPVVYFTNQYALTLGENITKGDPTKSVAERVKQQLQEAERREQWLAEGPKVPDCSVVVTQNAHWDASNYGNYPTAVSRYERSMWKTVQNLRKTFPAARIFVWSPHSMALGTYLYLQCPSKDWRNPPLIDFYKAALQRVVAKFAAESPANPPQYLDTTFIVKPMWDYALDWSHSSYKVGRVRTLFIAATILDAL
jgi:hypothetical protein